MAGLPLLFDPDSTSDWLITADGTLSPKDFMGRVVSLRSRLPATRYVLNLCEDRLNFMLGFVTAVANGQTVLLPSNRSSGAVQELVLEYPDSLVLTDSIEVPDSIRQFRLDALDIPPEEDAITDILIEADHLAAIVFTSGSTGKAQPNKKTWGSLVRGAQLARTRFGLGDQASILATVPPQHMYGLETTIMMPLVTGARVYTGRPFFAEDIRQALNRLEGERVLVTTPIHLRACQAAGLEWPEVDTVISATAPLAPQLATECEEVFRAPVKEIYGCTEAGSLASRQLSVSPLWQLYDDFILRFEDGLAMVEAPHLQEPVTLSDVIEQDDEHHFHLLGRHTDMVNIAGKRASISDLSHRLNNVKGVEDGVFILPATGDARVGRLAALVVAPERDEREILKDLSQNIDSVFLPRPIYRVGALPRNETGKLPRQAVLDLLERLGQSDGL
jgi:acyl-coenzyme A synthetase/AMP-(fatty) acid ligase